MDALEALRNFAGALQNPYGFQQHIAKSLGAF